MFSLGEKHFRAKTKSSKNMKQNLITYVHSIPESYGNRKILNSAILDIPDINNQIYKNRYLRGHSVDRNVNRDPCQRVAPSSIDFKKRYVCASIMSASALFGNVESLEFKHKKEPHVLRQDNHFFTNYIKCFKKRKNFF